MLVMFDVLTGSHLDQKSTFQEDFPQLATGGEGHHLSSSRENGEFREPQYGRGPSLRPQSMYLNHRIARDHRLRGSASPVLTATGFVNGKGQFSTTHRIDTSQPITKIFVTGDYVGDPYGCAKLGAYLYMGGFWAHG